jgi:alpha-L-rhamnosidase
MRYGYDMDTAVRTTVNALAVNMFRRAADLAEVAGRPAAEVTAARRQADSLRAAMNAHLVRADGLYVDGLKADGSQSPHASQHANAYAVAYGIAPPDRVAPVAGYAASLGMAMGPQTAAVLLDALAMAGRYDDVVTRLTDRSSPGWANVLAQGGTFTWETWTPSDAQGDSMSHGWGSTVLVNIQEAMLGVRADTPGWATFTVQPPAGGLARASGQVPTVRGPINVSWQRNAAGGGALDIQVTVPANASATVVLPGRSVHLDAGAWRIQGDAPAVPA